MTDEQLIAEGERLSKPCFLLTEEPQESGIVAYWGGTGRADIPIGFPEFVTAYSERRHWITVDCDWLARLGFRMGGTLSLYEDERTEGGSVGSVFHGQDLAFKEQRIDGTPLFAKAATSFPPLQAICLHGSEAVAAWLKSQGLERFDYDGIDNERYTDVWRQRCPLFADDCAAVLGGWHIQWPEDDFYMPPELKLLVWTLKDSEPWTEVWWSKSNFRVKFRIT